MILRFFGWILGGIFGCLVYIGAGIVLDSLWTSDKWNRSFLPSLPPALILIYLLLVIGPLWYVGRKTHCFIAQRRARRAVRLGWVRR